MVIVKRKRKDDGTQLSSESINLLLGEYQQCNEAYNSRDYIAADEFSKVIQSFFIFLTLLLAINIITANLNSLLHDFFCGALGVLGFISVLSLMLDIEGACSCKVAMRRRAREIEDLLMKRGGPRIWHTIDLRGPRFLEETMMKKFEKKERSGHLRHLPQKDNPAAVEKETEGDLFVFASRMFLVAWILVVIAVIYLGESIGLEELRSIIR